MTLEMLATFIISKLKTTLLENLGFSGLFALFSGKKRNTVIYLYYFSNSSRSGVNLAVILLMMTFKPKKEKEIQEDGKDPRMHVRKHNSIMGKFIRENEDTMIRQYVDRMSVRY